MTSSAAKSSYDWSVFINCPFDNAFQPIFDALVFTGIHCGFRVRCAREIDDGSQIRTEKIFAIIEECRFGIHDLSRTELDKNRLPRFNMPLELGMFLGAKRYGNAIQKKKHCLILDRERYRYQKFVSDIAGQDIRSHQKNVQQTISITRNWLSGFCGSPLVGGQLIARRYKRFRRRLPKLCKLLGLQVSELTFNDFTNIATAWLKNELQVVK